MIKSELKFEEKALKDDSIAYDVIDTDGFYSYGRVKFDEGAKEYIFSCSSPSKIKAEYLKEIATFLDNINLEISIHKCKENKKG